MHTYVFSLSNASKISLSSAGGKAANLAILTTINDINVPAGFCISTEAFTSIVLANETVQHLINELSLLDNTHKEKITFVSAALRQAIESIEMPGYLQHEISMHLEKNGIQKAYAVRSSATAEDLPGASFAGQQDSYLNIAGIEQIFQHISKCWASLYTDRAISYRIQNGFAHTDVRLAVIIQEMIFPEASGIMFTADPITGNRTVTSIDAGFGLGEAMVSGIVNADTYKIVKGAVTDKNIRTKTRAVYASVRGGTSLTNVIEADQQKQVLSDEQILLLAETGRKIEQHFNSPQDIEWCLSNNTFYIVQSRPITTLFPIPEINDNGKHVFVSVGHQQMMTDAIKPLGLSVWQMTAPRKMYTAGGRLFVDIMPDLSTAIGRNTLINVLGKSDPLIKTALLQLLQREEFADTQLEETTQHTESANHYKAFSTLQEYTATDVAALIHESEQSILTLKHQINNQHGEALLRFIEEDIKHYRQTVANAKSIGVIMSGINAAGWLNERMQQWLGERNVADKLSQSLPDNITAQMGLALLDVADTIRPYKQIINYLRHTKDDHFLNTLRAFEGGIAVQKAIDHFLEKYGMRCEGEIDITRPRWSEKPITLIPVLLANIDSLPAGESKRRFEKGLQEAKEQEAELLHKLNLLPDGNAKAAETKQKITMLRTLAGYREYPKYHMVNRYFVYKQALLREAAKLVLQDLLDSAEDIFYLNFEELKLLVLKQEPLKDLVTKRKLAYQHYNRLTPPRIFTSDGEIITGTYAHDKLPENAIGGLAVSSGIAEGRARIVYTLAEANLQEGDILVTRFTDPGWTPLFTSIKGLVTEVGGLMTHGSVIAREYGLPAVVGVENATRLIKDGQLIRVNGTEGYVELL